MICIHRDDGHGILAAVPPGELGHPSRRTDYYGIGSKSKVIALLEHEISSPNLGVADQIQMYDTV
jgi:hypothetical protein